MSQNALLEQDRTVKAPTAKVNDAIVSSSYIFLFTLANLCLGFCSITVPSTLVPLRVWQLVGAGNSAFYDALVVGIGAIAALIGMPVAGSLSDHSPTRRRLWTLAGCLCALAGYGLMGNVFAGTDSLLWLILGSAMAQLGGSAALVALLARIPEFSLKRRSTISGLTSMAPLAGNLGGQILIAGRSVADAALVLGGMTVGIFLLFGTADVLWARIQPPPPQGQEVRREHATSVRALFNLQAYTHSSPFVITWISRSLIFLALTTGSNYVLYYLTNVLHYPAGMQFYYMAFTLTLVVVAIVAGIVSDYLQRRKIPALLGSLIAGLALLVLALNVLVASWWLTLVAAACFGAGLGLYLACDLALITLVAPPSEQQQRHGRAMGLMNTSIYFPLILSPVIASLILFLAAGNYLALYMALAVSAFLAALFLNRVPVR